MRKLLLILLCLPLLFTTCKKEDDEPTTTTTITTTTACGNVDLIDNGVSLQYNQIADSLIGVSCGINVGVSDNAVSIYLRSYSSVTLMAEWQLTATINDYSGTWTLNQPYYWSEQNLYYVFLAFSTMSPNDAHVWYDSIQHPKNGSITITNIDYTNHLIDGYLSFTGYSPELLPAKQISCSFSDVPF